jgi:DNA-binding LacI/PurR family transcriptional regulator
MTSTQKPLVGIRAVAQHAGVSPTTVSLVLNGKGSFPDVTRARVREAAEALGYRPHPAARILAGARTRVIGLAFSHREAMPFPLTDIDYFARAIHAATDEVLTRDYSLVVGPPTPQTDVWFRLPLDGVVVFDPVLGDPLPGELRRRSTCMVVVGKDPNGEFDDPSVDNDAVRATRMSLEHLEGVGARRPALVTFHLMDAFVADCERTYRDWCDERGIEPNVWVASHSWERSPKEALAELLQGSTRPDAVVALEDALGIAAADAASDLGIAVPQELKVLAFSDRDSFPGVPLTSVQLDPATTARTAVNLLIDLIDDRGVQQRTIDIPVRLVRRDST